MQVWKKTPKTIWIKHASSIRNPLGKGIYPPMWNFFPHKNSDQSRMVLLLQIKYSFMFLCHIGGIPQKGTVHCAIAVILAAWG